jgi:uncharacterized protein (TIRG00374 family)
MEALKNFNWFLILIILALVLLGYTLRAVRWDYLLSSIDVRIRKRESYSIFFAGLSMAITPGKLGELIKPFILKDKIGTRVSKSIGVVFVERFTDLIGMLILATIGLLSFRYGTVAILAGFAIIVISLMIIYSKRLCNRIIRKFVRLPKVGKYADKIGVAYDTTYSLLSPRHLLTCTGISIIAWGLECFCFYLVLVGLGMEVGLLTSMFIFAFPSIIGVVSMLPGGLGVAEGSMVGLLILIGLSLSVATSATLIIRATTLWLGVGIGLGILSQIRR